MREPWEWQPQQPRQQHEHHRTSVSMIKRTFIKIICRKDQKRGRERRRVQAEKRFCSSSSMLHIHWQTIETTKCDVTTAVNPIIEISTDRQTDRYNNRCVWWADGREKNLLHWSSVQLQRTCHVHRWLWRWRRRLRRWWLWQVNGASEFYDTDDDGYSRKYYNKHY